MGCACQDKNRTQYEVVITTSETEKVVFTSGSKPTAETVSKRYPGSKIREKGATTPATAPPEAAAAVPGSGNAPTT